MASVEGNGYDHKKQGRIEMGQDAVLKTVRQFKKALESINIRVEQLILYGSHAVGTAREDSDIDVVVISSSFSDKGYWERIDILTEAIYLGAPHDYCVNLIHQVSEGKSVITELAKLMKEYPVISTAIQKVNFDQKPVWDIFGVPIYDFTKE